MKRARDDFSITEIDGHDRYVANGFPSRLEMLIDISGYFGIGEQHGSRKSSVRSCEALVELSHHLEQQDGLTRLRTGFFRCFKIVMPFY